MQGTKKRLLQNDSIIFWASWWPVYQLRWHIALPTNFEVDDSLRDTRKCQIGNLGVGPSWLT